jgi:adenylate kinase
MGPPGAGKGTQAKRLADRFNMVHLSSGDIFRAEKASGSELGKELAKYMDAGKLVPDQTVVSVMAKAIAQNDGGLLLDGFPRTAPQANALDEQLARLGKGLDAVVVRTADNDEIVARITGRRSCPKCGKAYHVKFLPPKKNDACDDDGTALVQRKDDTESVVRDRLEAYYKQTQPVIGYYRTVPSIKVVEVNGSEAPDQVTESMVQTLETLQAGQAGAGHARIRK